MKIKLEQGTLIGHRGASAFFPENTLESFEGAHQLGANWVESDAVLTKDKVVVLCHDENLEKLAGLKAYIANMTYEELRRIDVGSWKDPKFKGVCVPTLAQGLDCFLRLGLSFNLELKPTPGKDLETATEVIKVLREYKFPPDRLLISSFSLLALEQAYQLAPEYAYGWLADELPNIAIGLSSKIQWSTININNDWVTPELIKDLRSRGFQVLVYTVNDPDRARYLFSREVTAVFADDPSPLTRLKAKL